MAPVTNPKSSKSVTVSPKSFDFGNVAKGVVLKADVAIRNPVDRAETVIIDLSSFPRVRIRCGNCITYIDTLYTIMVAPKSSVSIPFEVCLADEGLFAVEIPIRSDLGSVSVSAVCVGPVIRWDAPSVDFGSVKVGGGVVEKSVKLVHADTCRSTIGWSIDPSSFPFPNISATPSKGYLIWGDEELITFRFTPSEVFSKVSFPVSVMDNGTVQAQLIVHADSWLPYMRISPSDIDFGPLAVGARAVRKIYISPVELDCETMLVARVESPVPLPISLKWVNDKRILWRDPLELEVILLGERMINLVTFIRVESKEQKKIAPLRVRVCALVDGSCFTLDRPERTTGSMPSFVLQTYVQYVTGHSMEDLIGTELFLREGLAKLAPGLGAPVSSKNIKENLVQWLLVNGGVIGGQSPDAVPVEEVFYQVVKISLRSGKEKILSLREILSQLETAFPFLKAALGDERCLITAWLKTLQIGELVLGSASRRDMIVLGLLVEKLIARINANTSVVKFATKLGKETELSGRGEIFCLRPGEYISRTSDMIVHKCRFRTPVEGFLLGNGCLVKLVPECAGVEVVASVVAKGQVQRPSPVEVVFANLCLEGVFRVSVVPTSGPIYPRSETVILRPGVCRVVLSLVGFEPGESTCLVFFSNENQGESAVQIKSEIEALEEPSASALDLVARLGETCEETFSVDRVNYLFESATRIVKDPKCGGESVGFSVKCSNPVFTVTLEEGASSVRIGVRFTPTIEGAVDGIITIARGKLDQRLFRVSGLGLKRKRVEKIRMSCPARETVQEAICGDGTVVTPAEYFSVLAGCFYFKPDWIYTSSALVTVASDSGELVEYCVDLVGLEPKPVAEIVVDCRCGEEQRVDVLRGSEIVGGEEMHVSTDLSGMVFGPREYHPSEAYSVVVKSSQVGEFAGLIRFVDPTTQRHWSVGIKTNCVRNMATCSVVDFDCVVGERMIAEIHVGEPVGVRIEGAGLLGEETCSGVFRLVYAPVWPVEAGTGLVTFSSDRVGQISCVVRMHAGGRKKIELAPLQCDLGDRVAVPLTVSECSEGIVFTSTVSDGDNFSVVQEGTPQLVFSPTEMGDSFPCEVSLRHADLGEWTFCVIGKCMCPADAKQISVESPGKQIIFVNPFADARDFLVELAATRDGFSLLLAEPRISIKSKQSIAIPVAFHPADDVNPIECTGCLSVTSGESTWRFQLMGRVSQANQMPPIRVSTQARSVQQVDQWVQGGAVSIRACRADQERLLSKTVSWEMLQREGEKSLVRINFAPFRPMKILAELVSDGPAIPLRLAASVPPIDDTISIPVGLYGTAVVAFDLKNARSDTAKFTARLETNNSPFSVAPTSGCISRSHPTRFKVTCTPRDYSERSRSSVLAICTDELMWRFKLVWVPLNH